MSNYSAAFTIRGGTILETYNQLSHEEEFAALMNFNRLVDPPVVVKGFVFDSIAEMREFRKDRRVLATDFISESCLILTE